MLGSPPRPPRLWPDPPPAHTNGTYPLFFIEVKFIVIKFKFNLEILVCNEMTWNRLALIFMVQYIYWDIRV